MFLPMNTMKNPLQGVNTVSWKVRKNIPQYFVERFLRSYRLLHFIAGRVLGDEERSSIAIQHCWRTASRNPRHFEHEGAFRSWLARVLIDEALPICEKNRAEDSAPDVVNTVSR